MPSISLDVFVTNKEISGKTIRELADEATARGIYLSKIMRHMVEIPVLPGTEILRGDVLTLSGTARHMAAAVKRLGYADRPVEATDIMTVAGGIFIGGIIAAVVLERSNGFGELRQDRGADLAMRERERCRTLKS